MANTRSRHSVDQIIEAIKDTGGLINEICERLDICRNTFASYRRRFPRVEESYQEECARVTDMAEGAIFLAIQQGSLAAAMYYLNNKARDRGYGQAPAKPAEQADEGTVFNLNFGARRKP
jgi:transposase-like protein